MFILFEAILFGAIESFFILFVLKSFSVSWGVSHRKRIVFGIIATYIGLNFAGYALFSSAYTALFQFTFITFWFVLLLLIGKGLVRLFKKLFKS